MRTLRFVSLLALASAALSASATIIDFEDLAGSGQDLGIATFYGPIVVSGGFRFDSEELASATTSGTAQGLNYTGSIALFDNIPDGTITMTRVDGAAFTLNGIDLANVFTDVFPQGSTITFTGSLAGGGTVSQSFDVAGGDALQTFAFSGFSDVTSVSWDQVANFHQFDNIVVNASAVPGPMAALPFALMALRRRKRA